MKDQKKKNPGFQKKKWERKEKLERLENTNILSIALPACYKAIKKISTKSYFSQSVTTAQMILALNTNEGMITQILQKNILVSRVTVDHLQKQGHSEQGSFVL